MTDHDHRETDPMTPQDSPEERPAAVGEDGLSSPVPAPSPGEGEVDPVPVEAVPESPGDPVPVEVVPESPGDPVPVEAEPESSGDPAAPPPESPGPAGPPPEEPSPMTAPEPQEAPLEPDWKEQCDRTRAQLLRVAADFDNFKKRTQRDLQNAAHRAREEVLEGILPVLDNMERAIEHAATKECVDSDSLLEGVKMVLRSFQTNMERFGVRGISAVGQIFDPTIHEAMSVRETTECPPGAVLEELRRGYLMGDRLVRPSLVVVAKSPAEASEAPLLQEDSGMDASQESPTESEPRPGDAHEESQGSTAMGGGVEALEDTDDSDGK